MLFISIVIPVFNRRKYIGRCIESILRQSFTDYEVIVVDDGSNDGTEEICDEYARKYEKVKVIHQKNAGVSKARNAGIAFAEGEYITFIDSDDYILPDYLQKIEEAYKKYGDSFLYSTSFQMHSEHGIRCFQYRKTTDYTIIKGNLFPKLFEKALFNSVVNKVYSLKSVKENLIKFPEDISLGEDLIFNLRYLDKQEAIKFLHLNQNFYQQWAKGRKTSLETDWRTDYFEIQKLLLAEKIKYLNKWAEEGKLPLAIKRTAPTWYMNCIRESVEYYMANVRKKGPVQILRELKEIRRSTEYLTCVQLNGMKKRLFAEIIYQAFKKQIQNWSQKRGGVI